MTALIIVVAICILLALSIFFWSRQRAESRRKAIRQYADEHHFNFLGSTLPSNLSLDGSSFRFAKAVSSAFTGKGKEKEFAFFDCTMPGDRLSYTQSVLAIYQLGGGYPACRFDRQLREERDREWTLVYHDRRAWSISEMDAHISSL
ncbi:MAG TPA: hypothetical protein VF126_08110 [Acidobacteriaceae bacterium]